MEAQENYDISTCRLTVCCSASELLSHIALAGFGTLRNEYHQHIGDRVLPLDLFIAR